MDYSQTYALLDAARDYVRIALARMFSPEYESLYDGEEGERLDHVAPHLFAGDAGGRIAFLAVSGAKPGEAGLLVDAPVSFSELRQHFRKFLTVQRERDGKKVLFRYYDPRVLRAFLPVCTTAELAQFFGPITAIHCQTEEPGNVISYSLLKGKLQTQATPLAAYLASRHKLPAAEVKKLMELVLSSSKFNA